MKAIPICFFLLCCGSLAVAQDEREVRQQELEFETTVEQTVRMPYLLYLPQNYEEKEAWPLLVFLHGAGERGDDLAKVKVHGPPKLIAAGEDFQFVVVSPQCASRGWWNADAVAKLVDDLAGRLKIDRRRMYLTGLSMGGYGTWTTAAAHPNLFAAIAPICGGGNPEDVAKHKHLPTWVFHGAKDNVVPLERSKQMVEALKQLGADVRLTVYPDAGHDSWTQTYANPELYEWLLQQKRAE